jgi:hypothetical protein
MNEELEKFKKRSGCFLINVLYWHMPARAKENYKNVNQNIQTKHLQKMCLKHYY